MRILIADDHELVRTGVRRLIESRLGWEVCGEAGDGREAVRQAMLLRPDIVVIDLSMPGLNGIEAIRQIRSGLPGAEVCVLSVHESEVMARRAMEAGARGYVVKSDSSRELLAALQALAVHKSHFTGFVREGMLREFLAQPCPRGGAPLRKLDQREMEILRLLAEGCDRARMAAQLGVDRRRISCWVNRLVRKLKLCSFAELVRYAISKQRAVGG